jgi:alpha-D-ribose 1-methylphosphonate 5-triphosphate synthase subunit PhnL
VTNHAGRTTEVESTSIAALAADADIVRRLLDVRPAVVSLPEQQRIVIPDGVIPDDALALVAELDAYGD